MKRHRGASGRHLLAVSKNSTVNSRKIPDRMPAVSSSSSFAKSIVTAMHRIADRAKEMRATNSLIFPLFRRTALIIMSQ